MSDRNPPTPPRSLRHLVAVFAPHIGKQRGLIAGSFLALIADTAFRLLQPWPLKFIFDRILSPQTASASFQLGWGITVPSAVFLGILSASVVAIAAASACMGYLSKLGMAIAAVRILADVRDRLFVCLQWRSLAFHDRFKSGDLITRVTADIERLRNAAINAFVPFLTNAFALIGMLVVMFWINAELALIALALLPIFTGIASNLIGRIRKAARRQRDSEGVLASTAGETLGAIKVVQALSLHGIITDIFSLENQHNLSQSTASLRLSALLNRTIQVLMALLIALILWRGSQLVLNQSLTPGDLLVFITYIRETFEPPMRKFANQLGQMAKAAASGERIAEILDREPQSLAGQSNAQLATRDRLRGAVRFERVSFGYDPSQTILHDLSFSIAPGQTVAVTGPSGSGKSTLIGLLLRLYAPDRGTIFIDDCDVRRYPIEALRQQISVVLQDSLLFATSIRENIAYGKIGATDREIERAARLAEAHDFIQALPQGYDTLVGERGATLSGGQRQRLAIARAAIRQAPIVVLDEPTTGLDRASARAVNAAFARLTEGKTTFVVSHNLQAIAAADLILYLEKGRLLEYGTHAELLALGGHYAMLNRLQATIGAVAGDSSVETA